MARRRRPDKIQNLVPTLWRMVRHFRPYLHKNRYLIGGSTVAVFAEVALRLLEPWPLKFIFDAVLVPHLPHASYTGHAWFEGMDRMTVLLICAASVFVITCLRAAAEYANTVGFALVGNRVLTDVRGDLYRHLQCLSLAYHTKARGGDLIVRIIGDIGMMKDIAVTALLPMLGNVLILVGMVTFMFVLNWQLAAMTLVTIPLFWLSTVHNTRKIRDVVARQRQRESAMAATAGESMGAIKTVQALSLESRFSDSFAGQNKKSLKEGVQASRLAARMERTVDVLTALATALVLWRGAQLVMGAAITPGDLIVFLRYLQQAFRPVRDFAKYSGRLAKATAAADRVLDVLQREPDVKDLPGAVDAPRLRGAVRFENVSFAYEPGQVALAEVNLDVAPGEHVAIVGPSGGGKTTMANLLLRLYDPTAGRVLIDGRDVREYTLKSLRGQSGVVLQDSLLFAASIRENIAYGAPDAGEADVVAAAALANAHEFITALPDGYETVVGERGVTLSGGQRQRIAIARAAVRDSRILILDEPATGLDEVNAAAVIDALEKVAVRRTTFYITHDLQLAERADVILVVDHGRITERGAHDELMRLGGRYARMYGLQCGGREEEADAAAGDDTTHALA
jgi:ATP-binding cassette subfamily B protein